MNDIFDIIVRRRSIRKFSEKPLSKETLEKIVEAGRWAPTGGNSQTVHFTVLINPDLRSTLRDKVQSAFAGMELKEGMYASMQNSIRSSQKGGYVFDYSAPVLIVVSNLKVYPNAIADSACALQNMMLTATQLGVGSCWINQLHWLDDSPDIRSFLSEYGISDDETICGALALGYAEREFSPIPRTGMKVDYVY